MTTCATCGHDMAAHTRVTNDGCMIEDCLCDVQGEWEKRVPALDEDDLDEAGRVVLAAIEGCHVDGLLYGGDSLDPSGWSNSTFPEAARRIAAAIKKPE